MASRSGQRRAARILLVEDDPGDQELTRRALRELPGPALKLEIASNGDEALDLLMRRGAFAGTEAQGPPDLVLLDLNLPGAPGRKVLEAIKSDPALRETPVVVLTTSARASDIRECYALGANAYVVKPLDARQFFKTFRAIHHFWFEAATLPGE